MCLHLPLVSIIISSRNMYTVTITDPYALNHQFYASGDNTKIRYRSNCSINGATGAAFGYLIQTVDGATKEMYD